MSIYGYCRISTAKQSIDRQLRNIKAEYPSAYIVQEAYTGTSIFRPEWLKLYRVLKAGDAVVFDSVSRMSRNAEEGFTLYEDLYHKGIRLVFLKEHHIDTETYKKALSGSIAMTGTNVDFILKGINEYLMALAKEQIKLAFEQSEKEVADLHQRTREGIVTAKLNGKQIGRKKGTGFETQKSKVAKEKIRIHGVTFVHYSGECVSTQTGEKATVGIYFKLNDDSSFEIDRMTMNGETLNLIMQNVALSEISDSYCKDHGLASSNALEGSLDELENALNDALADSSSSVSVAEPESETYTEDADSDNSAQTATRSDRKVVSTNGMDTYSELSGEISVDVSHYEIGEMPENVKEYYLSYGSDFDTAWLNALYTDVYEYSGKYSNQVAWERFTEYMVFYDEVVDYNNELAPALYDVYYAYDPATEEEAALCVDDVIQIAEENGAEIQIW